MKSDCCPPSTNTLCFKNKNLGSKLHLKNPAAPSAPSKKKRKQKKTPNPNPFSVIKFLTEDPEEASVQGALPLKHCIYHYEKNTEADTNRSLNEIVNFLTSNNTYSKERKLLTNGLEKTD